MLYCRRKSLRNKFHDNILTIRFFALHLHEFSRLMEYNEKYMDQKFVQVFQMCQEFRQRIDNQLRLIDKFYLKNSISEKSE